MRTRYLMRRCAISRPAISFGRERSNTDLCEHLMTTDISVRVTTPRMLAAVRRRILIGQVGAAWRPALDQVWEFLRQRPELRSDGHNIFVYHHPASRNLPMEVDFGVEVVRPFEQNGEVFLTETPGGITASALHVGPYDKMSDTHEAIHRWAAANGKTFAGKSWEIYGDWTEDTTRLETRIEYLLS
jgi:effector-binding domain-containing protein